MADYLIQEETLRSIANAIRNKTEKTGSILVNNFANEINAIRLDSGKKLPILDPNYPSNVNITLIDDESKSATFNITIIEQGEPAVYTYQWYVDGKAVSGANGTSYTVTGLSDTVLHNIYCEVTSEAGVVNSRIAKLNVIRYYKPTLNSSYPADVSKTVVKGKTVSASFSVSISTNGVPNSYSYQWYKDGTAVSGATSSTYTISGLGDTATHKVYCKVTNSAGSVNSRTATLSVEQYYLPTLNSSYPADATVTIKKSTTCKVTISTAGNPASYTYQWYVDDKAISGATSASYKYTPSAIGTSTVYCKVTNSAGTVTSRTATITTEPVYLYKTGDQCTSLTGGWEQLKYGGSGYYKDLNAPSFNTSSIKCQPSTGYQASCSLAITTNAINFSDYSKIYFKISYTDGGDKCYPCLCISTANGTYSKFSDAKVGSTKPTADTVSKETRSINISSLSGSHYVAVGVLKETTAYQPYMTIHEVYLA